MSPAFLFAQSAEEFYGKGTKSYQEGNYPKAIQYLEEAVKANPNYAPAYNALGLAYRETNPNLKEVAWYFKTAVDIDPNYVEAYDNLGKAYYGMGQFDKAEFYCKKALEISPDYGSSQFSLAWIYLLGKSRPGDAVYYFNKVLEKAKIPNAYFGLGMAYFMMDNRPMVLDMITTLRGLKEDKLAEQLENMVRDYHYIPNETGGALLKIKPPEGGTELQAPANAPSKTAQDQGKIVPAPTSQVKTKPEPPAQPGTIQIQRTIQILPRDKSADTNTNY